MENRQILQLYSSWMINRDIDEVYDIEYKSFDFPWLEADLTKALIRRQNMGSVARTLDSEIAGFVIFQMNNFSLRILDLAVKKNYRRMGVGSFLIDRIVYLTGHERKRIYVEVPETNLIALKFYHANKYYSGAILRKYFYEDVNAIVMNKKININSDL